MFKGPVCEIKWPSHGWKAHCKHTHRCRIAVKPTKPAGLVLADVRQTDKNKHSSSLLALACLRIAHAAAVANLNTSFIYSTRSKSSVLCRCCSQCDIRIRRGPSLLPYRCPPPLGAFPPPSCVMSCDRNQSHRGDAGWQLKAPLNWVNFSFLRSNHVGTVNPRGRRKVGLG